MWSFAGENNISIAGMRMAHGAQKMTRLTDATTNTESNNESENAATRFSSTLPSSSAKTRFKKKALSGMKMVFIKYSSNYRFKLAFPFKTVTWGGNVITSAML